MHLQTGFGGGGGRLPAWVKTVADFLNIRPVLSTKDNGTLGAAGVLLGTENLPKKLGKFVLSKMEADTYYTIINNKCQVLISFCTIFNFFFSLAFALAISSCTWELGT